MSTIDRLLDGFIHFTLVNTLAIESPQDFLDSSPRAREIFARDKETILRQAIGIAVSQGSLEVAFITANLFKMPWHGINGEITRELEKPEGWTVDRLIKSMPSHEEQSHFLTIARAVNSLVYTYMKDYEKCHPEETKENPRLRSFLQRQFWGHELQCRARVLRCLEVHCGPYVATMAPDANVMRYLECLMLVPLKTFSEKSGKPLAKVIDWALELGYHRTLSMGVQMVDWWKDCDSWGMEIEVVCNNIDRLARYCCNLQLDTQTWHDPWFQKVAVPLRQEPEGETDGFVDPVPEERTIGKLPAIF